MPLGPGRYRVMTTKTGKQVRLHFKPGGMVDEAKNLATGATHTPREFAADRAKRRRPTKLADHITALRGAGHFQRS
jgi:hypothetical protein